MSFVFHADNKIHADDVWRETDTKQCSNPHIYVICLLFSRAHMGKYLAALDVTDITTAETNKGTQETMIIECPSSSTT